MTTLYPTCRSCGMPLRTPEDHAGSDVNVAYCRHCAGADGGMKSYEHVLVGMSAFLQRTQGIDGSVADDMARRMMAKLPAWEDHLG